GMPQSPKPPTTSRAPSGTSRTASSAEATTLSSMRADDSRRAAARSAPFAAPPRHGDELDRGEVPARARKRGQPLVARRVGGRRGKLDGVHRLDLVAGRREEILQ